MSKNRRASPKNWREQHPNDECGCGSGLLYGQCCKKPLARMMVDEKGNFSKQITIKPELAEVIKESEVEFRATFGRSPGPGDRYFLDQFLMTKDEYDRQFREIAEEAGVRPAMIYATQKTGLVASESNQDIMSTADRAEWDEAVDEYYDALEDGLDLLNEVDDRLNKILLKLVVISKHAPIHFGSYLTKMRKNRTLELSEFFQALAISRVHELLLSFFHQLNTSTAREEIFAITRSLYECYLIIIYLEGNIENAKTLLAQGLVGNSTYNFKVKKDGKIDRRVIVDSKTGDEYPSHTSFYKMVGYSNLEEDVVFFDVIYESLSRHVHFSLSNISKYFDQANGFNTDKEVEFTKAISIGYCTIAMICDSLEVSTLTTKIIKRDSRYLSKMIRRSILEFLNAVSYEDQKAETEREVLIRRMGKKLANKSG